MFAITCYEAQSVDKCNHSEFPSHLFVVPRVYRLKPHVKGYAHLEVGQPALPMQQIRYVVARAMHSFRDYPKVTDADQGNRQTCFPPRHNPPLEDSFTRISGYRRTDHCAGAPVHMSQHDRRVSQHACQLTFPTLRANARGLQGERKGGNKG